MLGAIQRCASEITKLTLTTKGADMGHTNYWYQQRTFTDDEWQKVRAEYDYIKTVCRDTVADESGDEAGAIVFNGKDEGKFETFVLVKDLVKDFHFCKTNEKPYDLAVWHLLCFAKHQTNALSEISRDYYHTPEHCQYASPRMIGGKLL